VSVLASCPLPARCSFFFCACAKQVSALLCFFFAFVFAFGSGPAAVQVATPQQGAGRGGKKIGGQE
jgi:hypothetical protein